MSIKDQNLYAYYRNGELQTIGTYQEIAGEIRKSVNTVKYYRREGKNNKLEFYGVRKQIFAYYYGEELIKIGTLDEIAELLDLSRDSVIWMMRPAAKKRSARRITQIEGESVIYKHSNDKKAYKPTEIDNPEKKPKLVKKKATKAVWKPSSYTMMLYNHMFRKWEVLKEVDAE